MKQAFTMKKYSNNKIYFVFYFLIACADPNLQISINDVESDFEISVSGGNGNEDNSFINGTLLFMESEIPGDWMIFFQDEFFSNFFIDGDIFNVDYVEGEIELSPAGFPGRGKVSELEITVVNGEQELTGRKTIKQDNLDGLRQEYYDIGEDMSYVPDRNVFTQQLPDNKYKDLVDRDYHTGGEHYQDVEEWHTWWILGLLNDHANDIDNILDLDLRITAGYRCPVGNADLGSDIDSWHTKGKAMDYNQNHPEYTSDGSFDNYIVFIAAYDYTNARGDSYLIDDQNFLYFWYDYSMPHNFPTSPNIGNSNYYKQGHLSWPDDVWTY